MALVANTITRYDATKVVRESLADVITNISPEDTVMLSNIGQEKADQTYFEWLTDSLRSATADNAALEGDEAAPEARSAQNRVGNYTQISRIVIGVTGTTEAVKKAGMKGMLAYELAKAGAELKNDIETTILSNNPAVVGNNSTARKTAGLGAWIRTNVNKAANGTNPTMSSTNDGYPNAGRQAGTARTFTEALLQDTLQKVWEAGGNAKMVLLNGFQKRQASTFAGIAGIRNNVSNGPATVIGSADVYISDWGRVSFVPARFMPTNVAYVVDPSKAAVAFLRNYQTEELAKTGDSEKRMLLAEYGLKVHTEKAHGIVADLTTS
jgi:hypothetical protein